MKKHFLLALALLTSATAFADINPEPLLNKVILQLQAEQWVTTKTALVDVSVNAAVNDQGIDKVQSDVMKKLSQLSDKGEWHLLSFDRQLDKSGLESIQIMAEARLPQSALTDLRSRAKSISQPGVTFTIENVQFVPSEDEIRQANTTLRNTLYQQAKAEIDTLNKIYPDQKYYLHQIDFMSSPPIMPMVMAQVGGMAKNARAAAPLSIGNKASLQASVVLATLPDALAQKLVAGSK